MSTITQGGNVDTNIQTNVNQDQPRPGLPVPRPNPRPPQPNDATSVSEPDSASEYLPSQFIARSSLMIREVPKASYPTPCWFEPLGYCEDGFNRNCWCSWHCRHLFNGQSTSEYITVRNQDHIEIIKYNRMLTYIPMPLVTKSVKTFPLIEMYDSIQDIEKNLNFGVMYYTLSLGNKKLTEEEKSKIIYEHKAYLLMMLEVGTNSNNFTRRITEIPPVVRLNTAACVDCMSNHLLKKTYDIRLLVVNPSTQTSQYLNLKKCTVFTQSLVLLFGLTYAFPPELDVCLSIPPSYMLKDRSLVADPSKLHCGTYRLENGVQTYGSQCTISVFRMDGGGDMTFYDPNYKRASERCVGPTVNRDGLYAYLFPNRAKAVTGSGATISPIR